MVGLLRVAGSNAFMQNLGATVREVLLTTSSSPLPPCFSSCVSVLLIFVFLLLAELDGVPLPHSLLVNVFEHAHRYYTIGMRLYFGTIPGEA